MNQNSKNNRLECKYWKSNAEILADVTKQGQKFTNIDDIECAYKKTKAKLKKIFGTQIPNFYVVDDLLVEVSIRQHRYKGRLYENILITPVAECNGKFKQYELNWNNIKLYGNRKNENYKKSR